MGLSSLVGGAFSSANYGANAELFDQLSGGSSQTYSMNLPEGVRERAVICLKPTLTF